MKSKASLQLMEQLIMVLVFALAAGVCLRLFLYADQLSRQVEQREQAVYLAQNGAETVKLCGGDLAEAAELLGGKAEGQTLTASQEDGSLLEIERSDPQMPGLGRAEVRVCKDGEVLFSLMVAWQEVAE